MWQKFSFYDFRVIAHYLGVLMMFLAAAECVPFVVAVVLGEWQPASHYLFGMGVALIVGSLLRLILPSPGKLTPKQALAVTGFAWLALALLGCIPLYMSGHYGSMLDAVFEGMSAWTTTGCSLVQDIDHMSIADNTWRFTMQCIGGQGVVVIALSLGLFGRAVDSSLYSSEGRSEHVIPNIMQTARFIVRFSMATIVIGTILTTAACLFIGMAPVRAFFNGLWLAVASFNTGGMTSMSTGIIYYHCAPLEIVIMVLILLGSINFTLHSEVWKGHIEHFFRDIEIRTLVVWLSVILVAFVATLCAAKIYDDLPTLLRRAAFTVVAAFSSTGFQTISVNGDFERRSAHHHLLHGGWRLGRIDHGWYQGASHRCSGQGIGRLYQRFARPGFGATGGYVLPRWPSPPFPRFGSRKPRGVAAIWRGISHYDHRYGHVRLCRRAFYVRIGIYGVEHRHVVRHHSAWHARPVVDMWAGRLEYVTLIALLVSIIASIRPRRRIRAR